MLFSHCVNIQRRLIFTFAQSKNIYLRGGITEAGNTLECVCVWVCGPVCICVRKLSVFLIKGLSTLDAYALRHGHGTIFTACI